MIDKLATQKSEAKLSVLGMAMEKDGAFWYNETVLSKRIVLSALKLQREAYSKEIRRNQTIHSA